MPVCKIIFNIKVLTLASLCQTLPETPREDLDLCYLKSYNTQFNVKRMVPDFNIFVDT